MRSNQNFILYRCILLICTILGIVLAPLYVKADMIRHNLSFDSECLTEQLVTNSAGDTCVILNWSGLTNYEETGKYEVPVKYLRLLVPTFCNNITLEIQNATVESNRVLDYPLATTSLYTTDVNSVNFDEAESSNSDNKESMAEIIDEKFLDGHYHIITVKVHPVKYEAETRKLSVYNNIDLIINYNECDEEDMKVKPFFPAVANPFLDIASLIDNAEYLPALTLIPSSNSTLEWYYIIVPESLRSDVEKLALWKRQKGYKVQITTIEEICSNSLYRPKSTQDLVDPAASLRAYLKDQFKQKGAFFCLLVGDYHTTMPVRKMDTEAADEDKGFNTNRYIPTDNYFSDLTTSFSIERTKWSGNYCMKYTTTFSPNIYVGRLLCHTAAELDNYLNKLRLYESNPGRGDNSYLGKAFFFEQHEVNYDKWGEIPEPEKKWGKSLIHASRPARDKCTFLDITLLQDRLYSESRNDGPTSGEIIEAMRQHGFNNWYGHGSPYGVLVSQYNYILPTTVSVLHHVPYAPVKPERIQNTTGLDELGNQNYPSVVYSISCENMPYDKYVRDDTIFVDENLAQYFTTHNKYGGPAFLGNTREGWFSKNQANSSYAGVSPNLHAQFMVEVQNTPSVGMAEAHSKMNVPYYSAPAFGKVLAAHNLIGEPEFKMWLGKPKEYNLNTLHLNNGIKIISPDLNGAVVTAFDGRDNVVKGHVSSNEINVTLSDLGMTDGLFAYSIWKQGFLPVIELIGQKATLSAGHYNFMVRNACFGNDSNTTNGVNVLSQCVLDISATDEIKCLGAINVADKGIVNLQCDRKIEVSGLKVAAGGKINIDGNTVSLKKGTYIEKGGTLNIIYRQD